MQPKQSSFTGWILRASARAVGSVPHVIPVACRSRGHTQLSAHSAGCVRSCQRMDSPPFDAMTGFPTSHRSMRQARLEWVHSRCVHVGIVNEAALGLRDKLAELHDTQCKALQPQQRCVRRVSCGRRNESAPWRRNGKHAAGTFQ